MLDTLVINNVEQSDPNVIANAFNEFFINIGPLLAENIQVNNSSETCKNYAETNSKYIFL